MSWIRHTLYLLINGDVSELDHNMTLAYIKWGVPLVKYEVLKRVYIQAQVPE
jgi:hypothetical protein